MIDCFSKALFWAFKGCETRQELCVITKGRVKNFKN